MVWLSDTDKDLRFRGAVGPEHEGLFPVELRKSLVRLSRHMESWRQELLRDRKRQQDLYNKGQKPEFVLNHPATQENWQVAAIPPDLKDRRVEITGPISQRKMVINMLNPTAGGTVANTAMLDFEDSMAPTWSNVKSGLLNLVGVACQSLVLSADEDQAQGKVYQLAHTGTAHPMVRVRGLHLNEKAVLVDGLPISAGLFDLTCSAFLTARTFLSRGVTPKFYVPKTESYQEARWWNQLFGRIEAELGLSIGTLRATFLIETLPAAFQMEEILYEIRERACGLNGGRWDKIFSDIKVLGKHPDRILADRALIDMKRSWMDNYAKRLIKICHRHGAFAMGGMSAFTPGQTPDQRAAQTEKVIADKARESQIGHDGCWVSHPYFIGPAKAQFTKINQLDVLLEDFPEHPDLLPRPEGPKTLQGLRTNIRVGIAYIEGWNRGLGCIAFDGLMEDLATLEISRAQVWQWLYHRVILENGTEVTEDLIKSVFQEETERLLSELSEQMESLEDYKQVCARFLLASKQCRELFLVKELPEFFTTYWEEMDDVQKRTGSKVGEQREMEGPTT